MSSGNSNSRGGARSGAATTNTAPVDNPQQLLGNRLKLIMKVLVLQLNSLQTQPILLWNKMLDKLVIIKQRKPTSTHCTKPVLDAKTRLSKKDNLGVPLKFVPNSCRKKCPIESAKDSIDDPRMRERLELAQKDHKAWQLKTLFHAEQTSKLEMTIR